MVETYFALARAADGFTRYEDDGIIGCLSETVHPAANFSVVVRPNANSVGRLASRMGHSAYVLPTDQTASVVEMMNKAGYFTGHTLNLMFSRNPERGIDLDLESVTSTLSRYEHMLFLARQFFTTSNPSFCEGIAALAAEARSCELIRLSGKGGAIGGAMTVQVGSMMGLYNIAVAPDFRHKGLGSDLVRSLVGIAASRGLMATLQCSDSLVPWYERLGFRRYASVVMMRK